MLTFIKNWLNRRIINNSTMTQHDWDEAFSYLPLLKAFSESEIQKLKELTVLFMHHKTFEGARGLVVTPVMQRVISLQACLPILNLGLERYQNFVTIIIYPSGFITSRSVTDENGVKLRETEYEATRWYDYFETNPSEIMRLFGAPGSFSYGGY